MAVFFTKKQQAQMRERRRKKKLVETKDSPPELQKNGADKIDTMGDTREEEVLVSLSKNVEEISQPRLENVETTGTNLKRQRDESSLDPSPASKSRKRQSLELETKVIDGKLHVVVPNKVSSKNSKKFRKDARRQLRTEGKDDSNLVFVDEDQLPPFFRKSKKKKDFPSIKELLQQKQQLLETQKETEKLNDEIHQIHDNIKAQYVALDCEMVGIGSDGKKSALARVSIVDWHLNVLLDSFVKVPMRVTDFRTHVSGVEPKHLKQKDALTVEECRNKVVAILKDKILVGHSLINDFKALMLNHPKAMIRDTATFRPLQRYGNGKWRPRKLRDLVKENVKGKEGFQEAEHDSVQDAMATMELFQVVRSQWEKEIASKK